MAQQSYKKFVASAATATLVASALIPVASASANVTTSAFTDVPASYKEAVEFVVTNNIASGLTATQFGISQQIKRGDVAIMIAAAAGLNDEKAPASGFSDVPKRGALAINSLKAAGVISGKTTTKFGFEDNVTRGEAALMLQKAFDLKAGNTNNSFSDVSDRYDAAVDALVANKVTSGINATQFGTGNPIKRGDFAKFLFALKDHIIGEAVVETVKATDAKTLSFTGTGLQNLVAGDITVEGNKVLSVTGQGGSATATLETPLVDGQEYKVTVKSDGEIKEFNVKFTFVLADVAVTTTTLEANKDKQYLQVTLNGAVTDLATIDSLGYDIEFQADKAVFVDAAGTGTATFSATGEIDEATVAINDTFNVKAVLTKDGKTAESKTVEVSVVSKATPAIGEIVIATSELTLTKPVVSTKDTTVTVDSVESNTGDIIDVSGLNSFASSNPEVALINATTGAITPIKAGKTTISVKAGNVSYSKEITVVAAERKATKATAPAVNVAPGAIFTANVAVTDQFGEKLDVSDITAANIGLSEKTGDVTLTPDYTTNVADGKLPVAITSATAGTYTVVVKDLTTLTNLGQFTVKVSADNTADNYKLEVADTSKGAINLAGTGTLTLSAKEFTKSGAYLQTLDAGDTAFTVESANPTIATVAQALPAAPGNIVVTGVKVGSTQIILKKGGVQVATATVTVKEEVPTIESIAWKANASTITVAGKSVTYKDIFTVTDTAVGIDPIIENVKLNVTTTSKVRFDTTVLGTVAAPVLYLDQNDDGVYASADDEVLGTLGTTVSGSAGETITAGTDWTSNILGQATASGDKGTLVITVTDDDTALTVRASSTLKVDVK